jgi:hypothetical protein
LGRRSRKRRSTAAGGAAKAKPRPAASSTATATEPEPKPRVSRSEQRNADARAKLVPLRPGQRPPAVTVAAVIALALGIGNLIAFAAGLTINGKTPGLVSILIPSTITLVAGIGMWKAKYWAVLGFEALLGILICYLALFLVRASNLLGFVVPIAIIVPSGFLFWKLVKSLARIQMPDHPTRRPPA